MTTGSNKNNITYGGMAPSTVDTPSDIRTRINTISEMSSIPLPYIGMIVYVVDENEYYVIKSLKAKTVGPLRVENALVDKYEKIHNNLISKTSSYSELLTNSKTIIDAINELYSLIKPLIEGSVACTNITLNKSSLTFNTTSSQTLIATAYPTNTTDVIYWSSSNSSIATVSNGVVTPKANGSCTITATCGNYSATCSVTVNIQEAITTYSIKNNLTNVTTSNSKTSVEEGQSYSAVLTCADDYEITSVVITMNGINITDDVFVPEESTDDGDDNTGSGGDDNTGSGGDDSGSTEDPVTGNIVLYPDKIETDQIGGMFEIVATLSSSLSGKTITWTSSNNSVAVISNYSDTSGLLIINGVGTTVIRAICGSASATCQVTVSGGSTSGDDESG